MKFIIAAVTLVFVSPAAFSITCESYFGVSYARENAVKDQPARLRQLKAQSQLARSLKAEDLLAQYTQEEMARFQSQIHHQEILIANLEAEKKTQSQLITHVEEANQRILNRIEDLKKRSTIITKNVGLLVRIFKPDQFARVQAALRPLRSQIAAKNLKMANNQRLLDSQRADYKNTEQHVVQGIANAQALIAGFKFIAADAARIRAENDMQVVGKIRTAADKEAEALMRDFATDWMLVNFELANRADSYRELLEQRVCDTAVCSQLGAEIVQSFALVERALNLTMNSQRQGLSSQYILATPKRLNSYIHEFETDMRKANNRYRSMRDATERSIVEKARMIVMAKKMAFRNLDEIVDTLENFFKIADRALARTSETDLLELNLDASRAQFEKSLLLARELLLEAESLKARPFVVRRHYQALVEKVAASAFEIQALANEVAHVDARMHELLDTPELTRQEAQAVEDLLKVDFYSNP